MCMKKFIVTVFALMLSSAAFSTYAETQANTEKSKVYFIKDITPDLLNRIPLTINKTP